jgi:hypothetical protein
MPYPANFIEALKSPPIIAKIDQINVKAIKLDPKSTVIITGSDFISFLLIDGRPDEKVTTYHFWSYSKKFKLEVTGDGELYENYWRISNPNDTSGNRSEISIDKGSKKMINAGLFQMEWSKGDYIYVVDGYTVENGGLKDYKAAIEKHLANK